MVTESTAAMQYRVLPGANTVMGFQFKGTLAYLENDSPVRLAASGITGLRDTYRVFSNSPNIGTVLVIFKPGGVQPFFSQPLHEIFGESISLDNFMLRSELLAFEAQLSEAKTDYARVKVIEKLLLSRLRVVEPDKLVAAALALIYKNRGNLRIKDLAAQLHTSQSPLEKRFRQVVGASPKKFASIVRFKHVIQNYKTADSLTALGYEAGFYDQAHFIKEFRAFTGETPEQFFGKQ